MMVLGLSGLWLLLVVGPVVIMGSMLIDKFAPIALAAVPGWAYLLIYSVATLAFAVIAGRSLWRHGIR